MSSSMSGASHATSTRVFGAIGASVITAVSARAAPLEDLGNRRSEAADADIGIVGKQFPADCWRDTHR
jgi:hypothetical protein